MDESLSIEGVNSKLEQLKLDVEDQKTANESILQELYEAKKTLARVNAMKDDLEVENDRMVGQIQRLEAESKSSRERERAEHAAEWTRTVNNLQLELDEERLKSCAEIEELKNRLESLQKEAPFNDYSADYLQLREQHILLTTELEKLKIDYSKSKEMILQIESDKECLLGKLKQAEEDLAETKEGLEVKRETLESVLATLEEVRGENALVCGQLAALRTEPVDPASRGNSLFGELEDKRKRMEMQLRQLHSKYSLLKKQHLARTNEVQKLKLEKVKIKQMLYNEDSVFNQKQNHLIRCYHRRLEEMSKVVALMEERPESPQVVTISDTNLSNMHWIHTIIDQARADNKKLRDEVDKKAAEVLALEENIYLLSLDLKRAKMETLKAQALKEDAEAKIAAKEEMSAEAAEVANGENTEQLQQVNSENESKIAVKSGESRSLRFADDVKENDGVPMKKKDNIYSFPLVVVKPPT